MRHDLAILVASALLVMGSQTRVAADSGSLSQGSQDSQNQPRVQADVGTLGAVSVDPGPTFDLRVLAAGMASDPAVVAKSHDDDKDKDKDKNKDGDHRRDGDREKDKDKDKDHDKDGEHHHDGDREGDQNKDWNRDHDWGRGGDCDPGTDPANTPSSPTPEPGTLLLTALVAASAGLRARHTRKPR